MKYRILQGIILAILIAFVNPAMSFNLDETWCSGYGGTWSNSLNKCTITTRIVTGDYLQIPTGITLEINSGGDIDIVGGNNNGTIIINNGGKLYNNGTINNFPGGIVNNVYGTIINNCGGTINGIITGGFIDNTGNCNININLSPDTASNPIGTEHTMTATVKDSGGNPVEGILVIFSIISGPNYPWNSTGTTDASGQATFTYIGDGGIGTDSIIAFIPLNNTQIESDIVTKEWTEVDIIPPTVAIQSIINEINNMNLPPGVQTSLIATMKNIITLLTDNNPDNDISACGKLTAFINKVNSDLKNKKLTQGQANLLISEAEAIKTSLGC